MSAKQELIDGLNEDLNRELEAVLRYVYHAATATSLSTAIASTHPSA